MTLTSHLRRLAIAAVAIAASTSFLAANAPAEASSGGKGRVCIMMTKMYPPQCLKWQPAPKKDKHDKEKERKEKHEKEKEQKKKERAEKEQKKKEKHEKEKAEREQRKKEHTEKKDRHPS